MQVHQESIREIDRYIANEGTYNLDDKIPAYERYLSFVGKIKPVTPDLRILEVGTGTGWFPILCKKNGLNCKGLEISPQLLNLGMEIGRRNGVIPDIELGNIEDGNVEDNSYDVIIASSVFEHVEYWRRGLEKVYAALKPGGVLFFESTNKFMVKHSASEYPAMPFYGWLPKSVRFKLRQRVHGEDVMKLGIDFNQFTFPQLREAFKEIGFRRVLDVVDLVDASTMGGSKRAVTNLSRSFGPARWVVLTFLMQASTFVCQK
ncbi:MAG TPA: class I SAM-dependent methyltransferase [Bryobacteraceae bacterium]|jgi:2-polyprenyl-3-methyl-5-hydroxy-6-metoxy-1,4-benzoquinol methylase|nr:class I SAM-dependent methyltransferase [Bryobacteraceae bacterium]